MINKSNSFSSVRVLIIEGSSAPPSFVRNLILGLNAQPSVQVAVLAKSRARRLLPNVRVIPSDYDRFAGLSIAIELVKVGLIRPRLLLEARRLTTSTSVFREWIKAWYRIVQILRYDPQIIHFQWVAHIKAFQKLVCTKGCKIVISLRGFQINVHPVVDHKIDELYRRVFPKCYLHSVSEVIRENVINKYGVLENRVKVIYSSVPQSFFDAYEEFPVAGAKPLKILSIGRFHWKKGYCYALEAVNLLRRQGMDVDYTMVLKGGPSQEILYQISDRGLGEAVTIINGIPYDEVTGFMKQYDVLLLSSVEEGIANVVLEAMAVGLPVISTDCGGMREVVSNGETGWLVPPRNPAAIAKALEKFIHLPAALLLPIRRNAYTLVKSKFQADRNISAFCAWYHEVANRS